MSWCSLGEKLWEQCKKKRAKSEGASTYWRRREAKEEEEEGKEKKDTHKINAKLQSDVSAKL
jgi:broad specificity polyphosphatase/5'/3'-nucleotidase SurE